VGSVPGWIGKCCHGDDEMNVYRQLCTIVDEWIENYNKEGRRMPNPTKWDYAMTIISIYSITEQKIHDL
jgi:hypothetical protein